MLPSIPCRRFVARNIHKWRGSGHFCKITWKISTKCSTFSAKFTGVFAEVQVPGEESWNY